MQKICFIKNSAIQKNIFYGCTNETNNYLNAFYSKPNIKTRKNNTFFLLHMVNLFHLLTVWKYSFDAFGSGFIVLLPFVQFAGQTVTNKKKKYIKITIFI